ncbi:MAG: Flp pilus assembly protein CpaB [Phycicoccus sp.]|nr:Flp pilus assembly protein CpaB [Phycicoccus sp.]NMM34540.1 Flp pilus assembly protein CpaB [Phycicoccus sp.]
MRPGPGTVPGVDGAPGMARAGLTRLLPVGLVGPGRRPAWHRTRLRRAVTAGLVATAVWLAMGAFLPQPTPRGLPVVVVAQDLMPGHVLTRGDLVVADWPPDLKPGGAVADPATLVGMGLAAGMSRGEPVTAARVRGPGLLTGARPGLVAAHVRLVDPAMGSMATPGDHVDLISSSGQMVAAGVLVLAVDAGAADSGGWSASAGAGPPGGVVVAVSSDDAMRLAKTDPSGLSDIAFNLVLRSPAS